MITIRRLKLPVFAISVAAAFAFLYSPAAAQSKLEPFKDGDRFCAIGDENTQLGRYLEWIELFYLTRYPGERVEFINRGVSGDNATAALKRLDWDVLSQNPTVVSIFFGQNDVGPELFGPGERVIWCKHQVLIFFCIWWCKNEIFFDGELSILCRFATTYQMSRSQSTR